MQGQCDCIKSGWNKWETKLRQSFCWRSTRHHFSDNSSLWNSPRLSLGSAIHPSIHRSSMDSIGPRFIIIIIILKLANVSFCVGSGYCTGLHRRKSIADVDGLSNVVSAPRLSYRRSEHECYNKAVSRTNKRPAYLLTAITTRCLPRCGCSSSNNSIHVITKWHIMSTVLYGGAAAFSSSQQNSPSGRSPTPCSLSSPGGTNVETSHVQKSTAQQLYLASDAAQRKATATTWPDKLRGRQTNNGSAICC